MDTTNQNTSPPNAAVQCSKHPNKCHPETTTTLFYSMNVKINSFPQTQVVNPFPHHPIPLNLGMKYHIGPADH